MHAGGNNWVDGSLRVDLPDIYNAQDYSLYIQAGQLPVTSNYYNWTSTWLGLNSHSNLDDYGFYQVGVQAQTDGLHWFVEMFSVDGGGVTCLRGTVFWRIYGFPSGCRGDIGDIVSLNQWHKVELVKYTQNNYWIARVYSANGVAADVAKIFLPDNRIYRTYADFEEAYSDATDPHIQGQSWLKDPQYRTSNWQNWPYSGIGQAQHSKIQSAPNNICGSYYGTTPYYDITNPWAWYAGSGGVKCFWLFPGVVYDNFNAAVNYTGNWTHNSSTVPNAWKGTLSWSNTVNDKVSLTPATAPSNSITRIYTMAPNRGVNIVRLNGSNVFAGNDNTPTKRWQVARTWSVSSPTTIDVNVSCCGYTDADAFVVDIPRAPSPSPLTSGVYDNYNYLLNYVGVWTHNSTGVPSAVNSTLSWTNTPENAVSFTFEGNKITYYYTKAYNRGIAAVTIDGINQNTIDFCYGSTPNDKLWQQSKSWGNLGSGVHTIHIANTGSTTCGAGNNYIDVDAFVVEP